MRDCVICRFYLTQLKSKYTRKTANGWFYCPECDFQYTPLHKLFWRWIK